MPTNELEDFHFNIPLIKNERVTVIKSGGYHSLALTSRGRVFSWGKNSCGQIGNGSIKYTKNPYEIFIPNFNKDDSIEKIVAGGNHSLLLSSTGKIFSWGANGYGQLGIGNIKDQCIPLELDISCFDLKVGESIQKLKAGAFHSLALTSTGRIFAWGNNQAGQLGLGNANNETKPSEIQLECFQLKDGEFISNIKAGGYHSLALTSTGRLFSWGFNDQGQLGQGAVEDQYLPSLLKLSNFHLKLDEHLKSIKTGIAHCFALTSTGRLFAWGHNLFGQLGIGTTQDQFTPYQLNMDIFHLKSDEYIQFILASGGMTMALTSMGRLFAWGYNRNGQIEVDSIQDHLKPFPISLSTLNTHPNTDIQYFYISHINIQRCANTQKI